MNIQKRCPFSEHIIKICLQFIKCFSCQVLSDYFVSCLIWKIPLEAKHHLSVPAKENQAQNVTVSCPSSPSLLLKSI